MGENAFPVTRVDFRGEQIIVSDHALRRFIERWPQVYPSRSLKRPLATLVKLLNASEKDDIPPGVKVERIIHNGFRTASYYKFEEWRFVLSDEEPITLLTVERNYYKKRYKTF